MLVDFKNELNLREIMDTGKVLLVNLSKGSIGSDASNLVGSIFLHSLGLAAYSRADMKEERKPFHIFVDEFQNFSTLSVANMLSELRKYKTGMVLANQYLSQLKPEIRDAALGNVGTIISFRLGVTDAKYMEKEFHPTFDFSDIANLPNYSIYLKLMIDGIPSKPFSADTLGNINFS